MENKRFLLERSNSRTLAGDPLRVWTGRRPRPPLPRPPAHRGGATRRTGLIIQAGHRMNAFSRNLTASTRTYHYIHHIISRTHARRQTTKTSNDEQPITVLGKIPSSIQKPNPAIGVLVEQRLLQTRHRAAAEAGKAPEHAD